VGRLGSDSSRGAQVEAGGAEVEAGGAEPPLAPLTLTTANDLKCLPINFYLGLLTMFDALCDGLEGHFLGTRRGVELH